jgi:hypothetical protein
VGTDMKYILSHGRAPRGKRMQHATNAAILAYPILSLQAGAIQGQRP